MKKLLLISIITTLFVGCSGGGFAKKEKTAMKKADGLEFTAVQGYGLYGCVKSVTTDGHTISFDEYGNVVSDGNSYIYQSPTQYMINNVIGPYRIICKDNIRREEDEQGIEMPIEYEFDERGRVIHRRYAENMMPIEVKYTYDGRDKHPSSMTYRASYEDGEDKYTDQYTYLELDDQGNWTKRKVNRSWEVVTYNHVDNTEEVSHKTDPEFTETRSVVYFD